MTAGAGMRDQRLKLYTRHDKGTDGMVSPVYLLDVTRWGRIDETAAAVRFAQDRLQMQVDAVAEFADEVTPPLNGLLVDEADTTVGWYVRGFVHARQTSKRVVALERVKLDTFRTFTLRDSAATLDGTHVVNPS